MAKYIVNQPYLRVQEGTANVLYRKGAEVEIADTKLVKRLKDLNAITSKSEAEAAAKAKEDAEAKEAADAAAAAEAEAKEKADAEAAGAQNTQEAGK